MCNVHLKARSITTLTGYIQQPWVKYNGSQKTEWILYVCETTKWNLSAGLRVYPQRQGAVHTPFLFTPLHASHRYWMATACAFISPLSIPFHEVLRCSVKRRGGKTTDYSGSLFPLVWNEATFRRGVLSCITHQEERRNKQGQIHQTEGVGERWVLIKVEQLNSF